MNFKHMVAGALGACLSIALGVSASFAQSDKPIKLLVGFPPGGSLDAVARMLADKMRDELKQPVVVENRPGAGGRVAAEALKNAPADGGTLMVAPLVVPVLAPLVFSKLNYDPKVDFAPVGHVANFHFGLVVSAETPVKNVQELVAWMKANPKNANYGSPAAGSLPHFFGLMIGREAGTDVVHVPFAGGAPLQTAVLGGQVPIGIDTLLEWLPHHKAGKMRVIATSGSARSKVLPDVPTFREQGFANIVGGGWFAMYAPPKTSSTEIERVNRALNKALAMPDVAEKLASFGLEAGGGTPADLVKLTDTDSARWAPIVKASGFRAD
jgi:tripartite-type tricarboxylate transporter receptor subunit TctC